jgi:hypothetical protein
MKSLAQALALSGLLAGTLVAQSPIYPTARIGSGFEVQRYNFGGTQLDGITQYAIPFFTGVPIGRRLFIDVSGSYAFTRLTAADGQFVELNNITDTKVRASYTLGRDLAVLSLAVSVPTGQETVSDNESAILSSIGQNFLRFPVTSYGVGLGLTGGLALAQNFGAWNVGIAGSVRFLNDYRPLTAPSGTTAAEYSPGLEGRVRLGVDRLLGERARFMAGVSFSSFGSDEVTGSNPFTFTPGRRFTGELALVQQIGARGALQFFTWGYTRSSGDLNDPANPTAADPDAREQVWNQGLVLTLPVGGASIQPGVENRLWRKAGTLSGRITGVRLGIRVPLGRSVMLATDGRFDDGWLDTADLGNTPVTGFSGSLYLQIAR